MPRLQTVILHDRLKKSRTKAEHLLCAYVTIMTAVRQGRTLPI
jgi:hypothetical protein